MNNVTKAFFKSGNGVVLAVYDTRRGQQEGREAEKILAFYPLTAPAATQSSIVGLAQALTMFAGTFNKECPFHSMEAHHHLWTMYHAEPDLWLLLVVGRNLVGPNCLQSSLTGFLKGLHSVSALLYGLLGTQLQQDSSAASVRRRLQPLLQEAAGSLLSSDPAGLAALSCPLGLTGGVSLLPVSPAAFNRLQSLTNSLLVTRLFGIRPVLGVVACWQTCLLWSSVGSADTAALHSLAVRGLEPAVREGPRHKTVRRPITAAHSHPQQQQQQQGSASSSPTRRQQQQHASSDSYLHPDSVCLANPGCWYCRPDGLVLPVGPTAGSSSDSSSSSSALPVSTLLPRSHTADSSSAIAPAVAGAAAAPQVPVAPDSSHSTSSSAAAGLSAGHLSALHQQDISSGHFELPVLWLQSGSEKTRLLAWHSGPLLLLLLLENRGPVVGGTAAVTSSLMDVMSQQGAVLAAQLSDELPAKHLWHIQGMRYLYQDHLSAAVRASPLRKVATLSQSSLHLTADSRRWSALEAAAAADPTAATLGQDTSSSAAAAVGDGVGSSGLNSHSIGRTAAAARGGVGEQWESFAAGGTEAAIEVVVKGGNDCWVVGRQTAAGRQLTAVVEGDKDKGMLGVMRRVQGFCDSEVPGVFEGLA